MNFYALCKNEVRFPFIELYAEINETSIWYSFCIYLTAKSAETCCNE
jgi:hypothetical protein